MKVILDALKIWFKLSAVTNWQTTIAGIVSAISLVVYDLMQQGVVDKKTYLFAAIAATAGFLSKSANVTGGTTNANVSGASSPATGTEISTMIEGEVKSDPSGGHDPSGCSPRE